MLGLELAVPIDLGVVELEDTVVLGDLDLEVTRAGENFVLEGPKLGLSSNIVNLVDDGFDDRVLVHENLGHQLFVWEILFPEVQMRWKM